MVYALAKKDPRIVFIGSDLGAGVLDQMKEELPNQFFMEGIAEQNLIGMAAGLAMEGYIPYVNTIATFITRRCYEQIAIDVCLHNLPVRLIGNGGGLVYAPLGPTHTAIEDIAIMRALPNMATVAPVDAEEMNRLMERTVEWEGPMYIRLAKGGDEVVSEQKNGFEIGKSILHRKPGQVLIVSTGVATQQALKASDILKVNGVECGVLHMHTIKPIHADRLVGLAQDTSLIVCVEEHVRSGGLGSATIECLVDAPELKLPDILRLGIPDVFPEKYGSQDELLDYFGLSGQRIAAVIQNHKSVQ